MNIIGVLLQGNINKISLHWKKEGNIKRGTPVGEYKRILPAGEYKRIHPAGEYKRGPLSGGLAQWYRHLCLARLTALSLRPL